MPKKRFSAEQIVTLLRQIEVSMSQGKAAPIACRDAGISQQSFYRWRKEYGGLEIDQAKRMKDLECENGRRAGFRARGFSCAGSLYVIFSAATGYSRDRDVDVVSGFASEALRPARS